MGSAGFVGDRIATAGSSEALPGKLAIGRVDQFVVMPSDQLGLGIAGDALERGIAALDLSLQIKLVDPVGVIDEQRAVPFRQ